MQILKLDPREFRFEVKNENQEVVILLDPPPDARRLGSADLILFSHLPSGPFPIKQETYVISDPGEYERRGVSIVGLASRHEPHGDQKAKQITCYAIQAEDLTVLTLGDTAEKDWNAGKLEAIGVVDILMVPVGGHGTLEAAAAVAAVKVIEPKLVILTHYREGAEKDFDPLEIFLKKSGAKPEKLERLRVSKRDLPQEGIRYIILGNS